MVILGNCMRWHALINMFTNTGLLLPWDLGRPITKSNDVRDQGCVGMRSECSRPWGWVISSFFCAHTVHTQRRQRQNPDRLTAYWATKIFSGCSCAPGVAQGKGSMAPQQHIRTHEVRHKKTNRRAIIWVGMLSLGPLHRRFDSPLDWCHHSRAG